MRRKIVAGIGVLMLVASGASAHLPPGELFFLVQFPDNAIPTIDGDHSDWAIVPAEPYTIGVDRLYDPAQFQAAGRGEVPLDDFNLDHIFGWNENLNRLYFRSRAFDNIHNGDRVDPVVHWNDDNWEVEVNPDHSPSEEQNLEGEPVNNISYKWAVPPVEGVYQSIEPIGDLAWLSDGTDWVQFGWSFTGDQFGESTYYYELMVQPIAALPRENATPSNITPYDLQEEKILHISVTMGDIDVAEANHAYQGFWSMSPESCCKGVNDFVPAPIDPNLVAAIGTAVETASWGRIKEGFTK